MSFASKAIPSFSHGTKASHQPLGSISQPPSILRRDPSIDQPYSAVQNQNDPFYSAHDDDMDDFLPQRPFVNEDGGPSSRRSSFSSDRKGGSRGGSPLPRPPSLSINYVPAKFTKLHAPGQNIQRRVNKVGGGRDAFARDAQRMGMMGTVDDDEGVAFQLGKDGLRKKKPKLRWNRFKWILFFSNSVVSLRWRGRWRLDPPHKLIHFVSALRLWSGWPGLLGAGMAQHLLRIRRYQDR